MGLLRPSCWFSIPTVFPKCIVESLIHGYAIAAIDIGMNIPPFSHTGDNGSYGFVF